MPNRLVYYSLALPPGDPRPDLVWQFATSVGSLRIHNRDVPVGLFLYGAMPDDLARACSSYGVMVWDQGAYERRLAELCPAGWPALARYPLLHKFLNFSVLRGLACSEVLYIDCDTVFRDDVQVLFDRYSGADVVAREEVFSGRSPFGADQDFVDEPLLGRIAASERAAAIPPFNLGVVLFGNGSVHRLAGIEAVLVDYAWRFITWIGQHPANGVAARYGEFAGAEEARSLAGPCDMARALPFPSCNRWILDEVALWLALGHVPGIRTADFHPSDVAQNGEFDRSDRAGAGWIVCHYYSQNMGRIAAWLSREGARTAA